MELYKALRNIIQTDGADCIKDLRLVNILDDFRAYDIPASKYILRAIIADGYAAKLLSIGMWNLQAEQLYYKFATSTGFVPESVELIFKSLAFGLGWINEVTDLTSESSTQDTPKSSTSKSKRKNPSSQEEHLKFKNIEINGTAKEFAEALMKQGFTLESDINGEPFFLKGSFAGFSNCDVLLTGSSYTNQMRDVIVWLKKSDSWGVLEGNYEWIKEIYTKKYGTIEATEEFSYPYKKGDGRELEALADKKVDYHFSINTSEGEIYVEIWDDATICINYTDNINTNRHNEACYRMAENDI